MEKLTTPKYAKCATIEIEVLRAALFSLVGFHLLSSFVAANLGCKQTKSWQPDIDFAWGTSISPWRLLQVSERGGLFLCSPFLWMRHSLSIGSL